MLPAIPAAVMAEAEKVAKKAFAWQAREEERYWKSLYPGESLDNILAEHDFDYGDAYCFAGWAANEVFRRAGFCCLEEVCDIIYDGDAIEFDPWEVADG